MIRNENLINTTVYRKHTNTDIYINWNAFAPVIWKRSTLKTITRRAYTVCSTPKYLNDELAHIRDVFTGINKYPHWVVNQIFQQIQSEQTTMSVNKPLDVTDNKEEPEVHKNMLVLPYGGIQGEQILKVLKKDLSKVLPDNVVTPIIYTNVKLSSHFQTKDQTNNEHQHNVVYSASCPQPSCEETYIGETGRRLHERVRDHTGRDKNSHILKHSI